MPDPTKIIPREDMDRIAVLAKKISDLEEWKKKGFRSDEDIEAAKTLIEDIKINAVFDAFLSLGFNLVPPDSAVIHINMQIALYRKELAELSK